jgi:hypothetical protein
MSVRIWHQHDGNDNQGQHESWSGAGYAKRAEPGDDSEQPSEDKDAGQQGSHHSLPEERRGNAERHRCAHPTIQSLRATRLSDPPGDHRDSVDRMEEADNLNYGIDLWIVGWPFGP